jgi:tryptophan-rich sensory protein
MIFVAWKIDKKSAILLFPYAFWVGFAGILNFLISF